MSAPTLTPKERALLDSIAQSEYQDGRTGAELAGHAIWLDYIVNSTSHGGVLTSLQRKGLVGVHIVPMGKSDNRANGISDSTVWLTEAGAALTPLPTLLHIARRYASRLRYDIDSCDGDTKHVEAELAEVRAVIAQHKAV